MIWKWYCYGQSVERKIEEIKTQNKKKKSRQKIKAELYDKMMEFAAEENDDEEEKFNKRNSLKEKTRGAVRVYKLFIEIGQEKINNVKETFVSTIIKFTEPERDQIIEYFGNHNSN
ncbi:hypothetical protein RhiirA4_490137 [Rhizophagus irregularis]|uniref:Uncharacterized protein n=1 Tax=Rhizophagus irregularis TaxID=588596 RepID=A0A2I1HVC6_9GLOM|nr:hypothetical protein RhiirA4_490137 [Rhizophagus irregularis]